MLILSGTPAFRRFLKRIGDLTFHINTAYVGLEWVARGNGLPDGLEINWNMPKGPRAAVDQSRQLLHTAMLAYAHDCLDAYLRALSQLDWLKLSDQQRDILRKAVTREGGSAYAIWERFCALDVELNSNCVVDLDMVRLLVAWRNLKVHEGFEDSSEARLGYEFESRLNAAEESLGNRYGGLRPADMIKQFKASGAPRRKEIVGLVSAAVNAIRFFDGAIVSRAVTGGRDLEEIAIAQISMALGPEPAKAGREIRRLWGKNEDARLRRFRAILEESGYRLTEGTHAVGLREDFADQLAHLLVDEALSLFLPNRLRE
jgi:hypothetical protein